MMYIVFAVSCLLALLSFALFAALLYERIKALEALRKRLAQGPVTGDELKGFDMQLQAGPLDAVDKVIEAIAKLTDSLAKAPMHVAALIASLLFLSLALTTAVLACKVCKKEPAEEKPKETRTTMAVTHCVVGTFVEGKSLWEGEPRDFPKDCFKNIRKSLGEASPPLLLIIGHVDLRELKPQTRQVYASNLSLAYQRAVATQSQIAADIGKDKNDSKAASALASNAVLLAVGANHIRDSGEVSKDHLAADRVAEIVALTNKPVDAMP